MQWQKSTPILKKVELFCSPYHLFFCYFNSCYTLKLGHS
nr:MAG TPA: hypothetical protein [Bacteriophage sp.]